MRRKRPWLWLAAALLAAAPGRAQLAVSGSVVDERGAPVAGAVVELLPRRGDLASGLDELAGRLEPEPAAAAASDDAGRFTLDAPEAGFWEVRVAADGLVPMVARLVPLVEETVLPELTLRAGEPLEVTVRGPGGEPIGGAIVAATGGDPRRWQVGGMRRTAWWPAPRRALTDDRGVARLERAAGEPLTVSAFAPGLASPEPRRSTGARLEARLAQARPVTVRVFDERGAAAAGALVTAGEYLHAVGRTGEDGRLEARLGADLVLVALTADGGRGAVRLDEEATVAEITVAPAVRVSGRVVDEESRQPVRGALVWPAGRDEAAARSGPDGRFELQAPPGRGATALQAAASGYFPARADLGAATGLETVVALQPAAAVSGQVVDDAGEPLDGVRLTATIEAPRRSRLRFGSRATAPLTRSHGDGSFRLAGLNPEIALRLVASKEGWADTELEIPPLAAREERTGARLVMRRGVALTGRIVGGGEAVAEAEIAVAREPSGTSVFAAVAAYQHGPLRTATSDGEGRFELAHLAPGRYRLTVRATGFAPLETPGIELEEAAGPLELGTLELEPGVEISGVVVDAAGKPVAGAEVRPRSRSAGAARLVLGGVETTARTGGDGRFVIPDRRAGEQTDLEVTHPDYVAATAAAVTAPPDEPLRIVLEVAAAVGGRVVDPTGAPVPRAMVSVEPGEASGPLARFSARQALSDETGFFEVDGVQPGPVRVIARGQGWLASQPLELELGPGGRREGLRLELRPGATLTGVVSSATGEPVTDAAVAVEEQAAGRISFMPSRARTDGEGRYELTGVDPGRRTVMASSPSLGRTAREVEVGPGVNRVDLRFVGGVEVSGRVVDGAGAPIAGATVTLLAAVEDWRGAEAQSGEDGSFTIADVRDGQHILRAGKSGFATRTVEPPLQVAGAPISGLEIALEPGGAVRGRILGVEPGELSQVQVIGRSESGAFSIGQVSRDGTYRIPDLAPGEWKVHAGTATGGQVMVPVTVTPGAAEIDLDLDLSGGLTLTGQVLRAGSPMAGLYVHAQGTDVAAGATTRTDHQGRFRLAGLEPGRYRLQVSDFASGLQHREEVDLDGDRDLLVEITTARVAGWVLDAEDRAPLTAARVTLVPAEVEDAGAVRFAIPQTVTSSAEGRFAFAAVSSGDYRLTVEHPGYSPSTLELGIGGGVDREGIELALTPSTGLRLVVRRATGAPAGEITWAVLDPSGRSLADGRRPTDESGRVRLGSVPNGRFDLLLAADGTAVTRLVVEVPGPEVAVVLEPAATLEVAVGALADSTARATARVFAADGTPFLDLRWGGIEREWQLANGRRTIYRLPAGRYRVEVTSSDGRRWQGETAVAPGAVNRLAL